MRSDDPSTVASVDANRRQREESLSDSKRALLAALRGHRPDTATEEASPDPLRPGSPDAIVLVHPVGGELFCYRELIRLLPEGPAVYGLGADSRLGGERAPSLEDLAAGYLDRLEQHGIRPALLAGWSFGGVVAYEMAAQLHAERRDCELATIDIGPIVPDAPAHGPTDTEIIQAFLHDLLSSAGHPFDLTTVDPAVWRLSDHAALETVSELLNQRGIRLGLSVPDLAARLVVFANAARTLAAYRPGTLLERFWRLTATETADNPDLDWWREGPNAVPSLKVVGDHFTLLRPPAVVEVARFIADAHAAGSRIQGAPR